MTDGEPGDVPYSAIPCEGVECPPECQCTEPGVRCDCVCSDEGLRCHHGYRSPVEPGGWLEERRLLRERIAVLEAACRENGIPPPQEDR